MSKAEIDKYIAAIGLLVFSVVCAGCYLKTWRKDVPGFAKRPLVVQLAQACWGGVVGAVVGMGCGAGIIFVLWNLPNMCLGAIEKVSHVAGSVTKAAVTGYENGRR